MTGQAPARYAVYAVPGTRAEDGPLAARLLELGQKALAETGRARRYGWHATLKAPFRSDADEAEVVGAVAAFAARRPSVTIPSVALRNLGGAFWAVVPGAEAAPLADLASAATTELDVLRAPLSEADLARRSVERLSPRQRELLEEWGYPYVLDEFRWHFTLTDEIGDAAEPGVRLERDLAEVLGHDIPMTSIALCVEPRPGADFELHSIHPLTGQEAS